MVDITIIKEPKQKARLQFVAAIVNCAFQSLSRQYRNTLVDVSFLNSEVEKLREQRKQELMAAYKADEEERQLQMLLKKIGVKNWADILNNDDGLVSDDQIAADSPSANVKKDEYEEEKDYVYMAYKGDNDDADETEEDFVSLEAYDS
jgi:hypothetical protein